MLSLDVYLSPVYPYKVKTTFANIALCLVMTQLYLPPQWFYNLVVKFPYL